jgi:hypothetical protein
MNFQNLTTIKAAEKDGSMHQELINYLGQLVQQLQTNLSDEGYVMPQQTTANIAKLIGAQSVGAFLYDSDTNEFKVNINGTWKVVQFV